MSSQPGRWPATLRALLPFAAGVALAGRLLGEPASLCGDPTAIRLGAAAAAFVLAAALVLTARRRPFAVLLLAAGFLRVALPAAWPVGETLRNAVAHGDSVAIGGRVARVEKRPAGDWRLLFRLEELQVTAASPPVAGGPSARPPGAQGFSRWRPKRCGGSINLAWPDTLPPPLEGAFLRLRTVIQPIRGATNPGEWDGRRHALYHGVDYRAALRRPDQLVEHRPPPFLSAGRALHSLRGAMGGAIDRRLDGFPRRFARVLLLGDRVAFQPEEEADFRRAGVTHILSVSGLHVGLVAATVQILLGRRRRPAALATALVATWGYTLLVGAPAAAVRSAAMLSLVMAARHGRRVLSGPTLLSGAAFVLLLVSPLLLFDLGFLLSVLSVAGLLAGHHLLSAWSALGAAPRPVRIVAEAFAMTFCAQAATAPVTVALWGDWPLVAPIANLLVVGLSDFVLTAGLVALALDPIYPGAADAVFGVTWLLSRIVGFSVHQLAVHSPGVTGLAAPLAGVSPLCLGLAGLATWAAVSRRSRAAGGLGLLWALSLALLVAAPRRPPAGLRVTVLDVGQGDATLLEFPDGRSLLVDGGEGGQRDTGGRVVLPAIRAARLSGVDAVIVSHAHHDHEGGLLGVVAATRVGRVFETGLGPADGEPERFRDLCWRRGTPVCLVAAGDTLLQGEGYIMTALWPPRPADPADDYERPGDALNDLSLVLLVEWKGHRLLFPGDLEGEAEAALAGRPDLGPVEFLKAGHHGSRTSSTEAWLQVLSPEVASVSVGAGNKFRHPSREVMARYAGRGIAVHRTDRGGAFRLTWTREGIRYERWGDGLGRAFHRGFVRRGERWPPEFLDASATIW